MAEPSLTIEQSSNSATIRILGELLTRYVGGVQAEFDKVPTGLSDVQLDLAGLDSIDTGGAWLIAEMKRRLETGGAAVRITSAAPAHAALLETVTHHLPDPLEEEDGPRGLSAVLISLGKMTVSGWQSFLSALAFFGETLAALVLTLLQPWRLRRAALFSQMESAGLKAVPIVALMGFLIGVVLAFQGAAQLKQFGAEVFVVELIAISVLRELGILLTAIIVAGRSGSAFTASVGSMKVQEEIDAMRTIGLSPIEALVVPRVLALIIMMPILGFIANIAGLFGGALMSWIDLGVTPGMFITRLKETTDVWNLLIGMIKAPFFALMIGVVACWQAMQVRGSAESVGQHTTASVVQSIFMVIAIDAMFSIFFSELGV
ncbi:MlaE family lipid ABC transporter permease subunit [Ruegeria sp. 2012CJ41-6]|uniref:MlaE family lipid ABC transporter permease subunit n=1 Tax=Ruegeria spongiae TaxID=2942209 RepID=A0ABT0Q6K9_9RHOB|nr:MlaE family lipid ABC transporter permease subunit [Ruegeria spongiae]MCL6285450.1 MlaE family lipid ABC transporter permease subunit [Ruegeria spongiae]